MAGPELTSPRSPRVKAARRLGRRGFREQQRLFLAEGPQAVGEALGLPGCLQELFVTDDAAVRHTAVLDAARDHGVPVHLVSGEVMAGLAQTVTPQGLVGVCAFVDVGLADVLAPDADGPSLVAVLAHVRDPGNAGSVLRVADAAGADAVVFSTGSVDPYNGKCVRASVGSLFHLPVVTAAGLADTVAALREAGMSVLAADASGRQSLDEAADAGRLDGPVAWLFGNEAWGLPDPDRALADSVVSVPIHGRAESLNLATAAALCLYACARAQRGPHGCRAGVPDR